MEGLQPATEGIKEVYLNIWDGQESPTPEERYHRASGFGGLEHVERWNGMEWNAEATEY